MNNRNLRIVFISAICLGLLIITTSAVLRKINRSKNPKSLLIVGDSQSAIKTDDGRLIKTTYPNILQQKLKDKNVQIDVLASIGKSTSWMKNKLKEKLSDNKYDIVLIYGGGNDAVSSNTAVNQITDNIQEMVNVSKKNGAEVIVNLGYRVDGSFANYKIMPITPYITSKEKWIPIIEKKKQLQSKIPLVVEGAYFVLPYDLKDNTEDGIHPNATGHKIVAEKIYEVLSKIYF